MSGTKTRIEWADRVLNPVTGCSPVSEGCRHCYAARMARRLAGRCGYPADEPFRVTLHPDRLTIPRQWRTPQRVFVNSMSDLFHDDVPDEFIDRVFAAMALMPQHTYMILTKRPERMRRYLTWVDFTGPEGDRDRVDRISRAAGQTYGHGTILLPLPNVWLGVSAENQAAADERIPLLLATPAAVRFVSCEPLLGPVNLRSIKLPARYNLTPSTPAHVNALDRCDDDHYWNVHEILDWVIAGGESGPGARPMHPDWARGLRDQCCCHDVPFFFKQWGEWFPRDQWEHNPELVLPNDHCANIESPITHVFADADGPGPVHRVGKRAAGRLLDGREILEVPRSP